MNPDFLKYLQQITAALRSGVTLGGDPLGELQKRASQIGEGFGTQFEHDRAQAGYTNALVKQYSGGESGLRGQIRGQLDPHTQRAQQENMQNAAMLALGSLKPELGEKPVLTPAMRSYGDEIFTGTSHADAAIKSKRNIRTFQPEDEGYVDPSGKWYSRVEAEKVMDKWLSKSVKGQMKTRNQQSGTNMGLTSEDLNGKLYANRGTKADAPMTLDDLNRIMAKKEKRHAGNSDAEGVLAQESARGATAHTPTPEEPLEFWHGTPSGDLRGAKNGLHIGTRQAAKEALESRIGTPAEGEWDGTREYGKTLLKPGTSGVGLNLRRKTYPTSDFATYSDGTPVALDAKPNILKVRLKGPMVNTPDMAKEDAAANEIMQRQLTRGRAKKGYFYQNINEDNGSVSAVVPSSAHLEVVDAPEKFGPQRTTIGPNDAVPPFWGTRLHSALVDKGGFTIDPETGADLTSGYSVGGGEKAGVLLKKPLADLKPTELQSFLNANKSKLQPGQAWGGWVQDGHVYVEPADQVADINEAQRLGNERGEQAIWDHANGKEIPLKAAKAAAAAQAAAAQEPYRDVLDKWHTAWGDFTKGIAQLPKISQERGADVLAAKKFPSSNAPQPWLAKYTQHDIERPVGNPKKLADVEDIAYKTFNTPQFKKWLAAGQGTGTWYDTRETMGRAIDALGEKLGPKAFNEFIDHLAASTAMSRPENNIRRASWWRALNLQGLLNPEELRSSTLAAPEGMGHIAQKAHHFATADLVQNGTLNALANPKPASFAENLKMNQRPVTFDTRMSNAALSTEPKMSLGLAGVKDDATPRKWAYAPIERAAQRVAAEAHARGDLDPVPRGVDPTATWQAQVWGGIGRADKTRMMSANNPSFHAILDQLLSRSAKLWGVSPTKANELFWKGQPLDLPLDASLLKGPSRKR